MRILGVEELTAYIKDLLQSDPILSDVWVRGEISNFIRSAAGHIYFTLKAEKTQLKCVLFRGNARFLTFVPNNGDAVLAHGNVSLYEASGQYQLYVDLIQPEGTGLLQLKFQELHQRLEQEGLFEPSRKRPLPVQPRYVGVVTSPTGAVWHDIQTVIRRRYPLCHLLLSPAQVQGDDAPRSIARALDLLQSDGRAEVIVVARGGGSMEDLWCFNDERVARAVFACRVPVISAIGHETDYTICDFVADVRAATPSAAAELVTPHLRELADELRDRQRRLDDALLGTLADARVSLSALRDRIERQSPENAIGRERLGLDRQLERMAMLLRHRITGERGRVEGLARQIALLHPQQIMERGYVMVLDPSTGNRVAAASALRPEQNVLLRFHDGTAEATVRETALATRGEEANGRRTRT